MTTHYEPPHVSDLVSENVRALMARTRTRQQALALVLGMTQGAVSKKVNGDRPFTLDEVEIVARHFGVPIASLFEGSNALPFPRGLAADTTTSPMVDTHEYTPVACVTTGTTRHDWALAS
jgi:transcriptional regulator with XRE-family HTH domain